jgi:alpha-galactosidase
VNLPPRLTRSTRRRLRAGALALAAALTAVTASTVVLTTAPPAAAWDNGLALTPQMGFNDWNAYGCNVSENLIKSTAQAMHDNGMQAAGYTYVNIDDCWMTHSRDGNGRLVPDPAKFPDGIAGTADFVHSLGLKLGIYEDAGSATCAGYPGSLGHESTDAQTFASWGVDYLKYDNCNNDGSSARTRYTAMRDALAATGRPILFSLCSWGQENVWTWGADIGNSWRTTGDIQSSYSSMLSIFHSNVGLAQYAGPGHWNDPDMLEVGNGGMSVTEQQTEFSLWAEMAAPLIAGTDIARASADTLGILTNKAVIAVDQDPLGRQGTEVSNANGLHVLAKPLADGDVAVALFNETGGTATIATTTDAVGAKDASGYTLTNLWTGATSTTDGAISASVPAHGTVMYRVTADPALTR